MGDVNPYSASVRYQLEDLARRQRREVEQELTGTAVARAGELLAAVYATAAVHGIDPKDWTRAGVDLTRGALGAVMAATRRRAARQQGTLPDMAPAGAEPQDAPATVRQLIERLTTAADGLPDGLDTPVEVGIAEPDDTYDVYEEISVTTSTATYTYPEPRLETTVCVLGVQPKPEPEEG